MYDFCSKELPRSSYLKFYAQNSSEIVYRFTTLIEVCHVCLCLFESSVSYIISTSCNLRFILRSKATDFPLSKKCSSRKESVDKLKKKKSEENPT